MTYDCRRLVRIMTRAMTVAALRRMVGRCHCECMRLAATAMLFLMTAVGIHAQSGGGCTTLTSDNPSSVSAGSGAIFDLVTGTNIDPPTVQLVIGSMPGTITGTTPIPSTGVSSVEVVVDIPSSSLTTPATLFLTNVPSAGCLPTSVPLIVTGGVTILPPQITKYFADSSIPLGGTTALFFTITNPNASTELTGVGVVDTLPAGLQEVPGNEHGMCGGGTITISTVGGVVGAASIVSLSGASLQHSASCSFSVLVTGVALGGFTNTTGEVFSNQAVGATASAPLTVTGPPGSTLGLPKISNQHDPWVLYLSNVSDPPSWYTGWCLNQTNPPPSAPAWLYLLPYLEQDNVYRASTSWCPPARASASQFQLPYLEQDNFHRAPPSWWEPVWLPPYIEQQKDWSDEWPVWGPINKWADLGAVRSVDIGRNPPPSVKAPPSNAFISDWQQDFVGDSYEPLEGGGVTVGGNTSTGNLWGDIPSLKVCGVGAPPCLQLHIYFNSEANSTGFFGNKWSSLPDMFLNVSGTQAQFHDKDGQVRDYDCVTPTFCLPLALGDASRVMVDPTTGNRLVYPDQTQLHFDGSGFVIGGSDSRGYNLQITRNTVEQPIKITDSLGAEIDFQFGSDNLVKGVSDPSGGSESFTHDTSGNLVGHMDAGGNPWQFIYGTVGDLNGIQDPKGNQTIFAFNTFHQVTSIADAAGKTSTFNYTTGGTTVVTDPLGHNSTIISDPQDRAQTIQDPSGGMETVIRDAGGFVGGYIDKNSNPWFFINNIDGYPTQVTNPLGDKEFATYDTHNNQTSFTDWNGVTYTNTFDSNNHLTSILNPLGGTRLYSYDSVGRVIREVDENGVAKTLNYDDLDRIIIRTDAAGTPDSFKTKMSFDGIGRPVEFDAPGGRTDKFEWDGLSRLTRVDQAAGTSVERSFQLQYDADSNPTLFVDPRGIQTKMSYDRLNRPTRIDRASGLPEVQTETRGYDAVGNLTQGTIGGVAKSYDYDASNHLIKVTLGNDKTYSEAYDLAGNVVSTTDGNGNTNTFQYDGLNRLGEIKSFDGNNDLFTYDKNSNTLSETNNNGSTTYAYDSLNRRTSSVYADSTNGMTTRISVQYDPVGNEIQLTYPDSTFNTFSYNHLNLQTQIIDRNGSATNLTYDSLGFLARKDFANGVSSLFTHDVLGRTTFLENVRGTLVLSSQAVVLDADDEVTQSTSFAGGVTRNVFNALGRLTQVTAPNGSVTRYTYDGFGDRTSVTSPLGTKTNSFDLAGWETNDAGQILTNDGNGDPTNDGVFNYGYNALGRLTFVSNATVNDQYTYDGAGRRVRRQDSTGDHRFFFDPANGGKIFETSPSGPSFLVWGPGNTLISDQTPAGSFFYTDDVFGSSMTITGPTGNILANYSYDAFGQKISVTDPLRNKNEHYFLGLEQDPDASFIYWGVDYYSAKRGRFLDQGTYAGALREESRPVTIPFP